MVLSTPKVNYQKKRGGTQWRHTVSIYFSTSIKIWDSRVRSSQHWGIVLLMVNMKISH